MSDNVIVGPWATSSPYRLTPEQKNDAITDYLISEMVEAMFDGLQEAGFDNCEDMYYTKDLAMIAESLRSYIYKLQERYHCVQDVCDQLFDWNAEGTSLATNPSVHVDFLPNEED